MCRYRGEPDDPHGLHALCAEHWATFADVSDEVQGKIRAQVSEGTCPRCHASDREDSRQGRVMRVGNVFIICFDCVLDYGLQQLLHEDELPMQEWPVSIDEMNARRARIVQ